MSKRQVSEPGPSAILCDFVRLVACKVPSALEVLLAGILVSHPTPSVAQSFNIVPRTGQMEEQDWYPDTNRAYQFEYYANSQAPQRLSLAFDSSRARSGYHSTRCSINVDQNSWNQVEVVLNRRIGGSNGVLSQGNSGTFKFYMSGKDLPGLVRMVVYIEYGKSDSQGDHRLGEVILRPEADLSLPGDQNSWREFSFPFTLPAETTSKGYASFRIKLIATKANTVGTLWIDDFQIFVNNLKLIRKPELLPIWVAYPGSLPVNNWKYLCENADGEWAGDYSDANELNYGCPGGYLSIQGTRPYTDRSTDGGGQPNAILSPSNNPTLKQIKQYAPQSLLYSNFNHPIANSQWWYRDPMNSWVLNEHLTNAKRFTGYLNSVGIMDDALNIQGDVNLCGDAGFPRSECFPALYPNNTAWTNMWGEFLKRRRAALGMNIKMFLNYAGGSPNLPPLGDDPITHKAGWANLGYVNGTLTELGIMTSRSTNPNSPDAYFYDPFHWWKEKFETILYADSKHIRFMASDMFDETPKGIEARRYGITTIMAARSKGQRGVYIAPNHWSVSVLHQDLYKYIGDPIGTPKIISGSLTGDYDGHVCIYNEYTYGAALTNSTPGNGSAAKSCQFKVPVTWKGWNGEIFRPGDTITLQPGKAQMFFGAGPFTRSDLDGNGCVEDADLLFLVQHYGEPETDVNGDGVTDGNDVNLLSSYMGNPACPSGKGAIPAVAW